jgi:vacuolar iron transporter family protein
MKHSLKTGLGFGVTSGIITTLGLMVGLNSGTQSVLAVVGGVLTIAIADAFSDALGIHVSKEFENKSSSKEIWESTLVTFLSKFFMALLFIFPILIFKLKTAVIISVIMGISLLAIFSYIIAKEKKTKPLHVILEHVTIAAVVIIISQLVGSFIGKTFV